MKDKLLKEYFTKMVVEKRKYKRIKFAEPLQYRQKEGAKSSGSLTCDVSEGGVRFKSNDFIPLSENLSLEMEVDAQRHLRLQGRVAWVQMVPYSETYQVGLEFDDSELSAESKREIREYIRSHQK